MSAEDIRIIGDPVLRKKAEYVTVFDDQLKATVDNMFEVMFEADGIGLAAPQVGLSQSFLVIGLPQEDDEPQRLFFANPKIVETSGESWFEEGCLSVPEIREEVLRPDWIKVEFQDLDGNPQVLETGELLARVLQHEIDHLNGILFVDRITPARKVLIKNSLQKLMEEGSA